MRYLWNSLSHINLDIYIFTFWYFSHDFLSLCIYNFNNFSTNFYRISENGTDDAGYPPGVAEKIVVGLFRSCNPNRNLQNRNIFLPAAVAEEVEITTFEDQDVESFSVNISENLENTRSALVHQTLETNAKDVDVSSESFRSLNINTDSNIEDEKSNVDKNINIPPHNNETVPETSSQIKSSDHDHKQENSESYNGAIRETFSWSQNICELGKDSVIDNIMLLDYFIIKNKIFRCYRSIADGNYIETVRRKHYGRLYSGPISIKNWMENSHQW